MEQLSSCYFCGAALDASLDEYPVIPKSLHPDPDDQRTVVLCQGCRRKLGTIVESVVDAAPDESAGATPAAGDAAPVPDDSEPTADDVTPKPAPNDPEPTADDPDPAADAAAGALDDTAAVADTSSVTDERPTPSADASGGADDDAPRGAGDGTDTGAGNDSADVTRESSAGTAAGETKTTTGDDGPSLSALEYNKVMRLLQNREFPVEKDEIRTVAVNAYEISESEFEAVVDAAVSRGLITEENGQFVED